MNKIRTLVRHLATRGKSIEQSYVHGASTVPLLNDTIGEVFVAAVEANPEKELFVFPQQNVRRTYAQVYNEARKLASGFLSIGLRPGDRIGICAPNVYEWTLVQFAAALSGLVLVGVKCLVSVRSFKTQHYYEMLRHMLNLDDARPGSIHSPKLPELKHVLLVGNERKPGTWLLDDVLESADSNSTKMLSELRLSSEDPINIQYTSGTTGSPKGATLSHHNIVNNAYFIGRRCGYHIETNSKIVCSPPLYHCFGCVASSLCAVVHKATAVFPAEKFDAYASLKAASVESILRGTSMYGTPTMFIDMLNEERFSEFDLSSLTTGIMAGAPCPTELCSQVVERLNMKQFTILYGTTENSPATFQTVAEDDLEHRTKTAGRIHDHVEAKVVDAEGHIVPRGQPGELLTRGYCIMRGYWNDEAKTRETITEDRWYHTGDLVVLNPDGYLRVIGRIRDMIIRGGSNVYPTEIEQLLFTYPKIMDAHVIGVPDDRLGEEICAWIRLHKNVPATTETADEIRAFCKENAAYYKVPKYILFKTELEIPITVTGKIQKFKMRDTSIEELKLGSVKQHWSA